MSAVYVVAVIPPAHLRANSYRLFSEPESLTIWRLQNKQLPIASTNIGYTELNPQQASRVDTEFDLWAAERLVKPHRIGIRCVDLLDVNCLLVIGRYRLVINAFSNNSSENSKICSIIIFLLKKLECVLEESIK